MVELVGPPEPQLEEPVPGRVQRAPEPRRRQVEELEMVQRVRQLERADTG